MSSSYINADLRRSLLELAGGICEYCLISQDDAYLSFEVDSRIFGLTPIGKVTVRLLELNANKRLEERDLLRKLGTYPGIEGSKRLQVKT